MSQYKSTSLADQIFDRLEDDIIQGVYPRGEILTELKLVEQLNVSRTPIREAVRRLEQERLIEETGKGSRILGITEDDLWDIMTIREHIEGICAYYAAKNISEEGIKEMAHLVDLQEFYYTKGDAEHLQFVDDQFHNAICTYSGRQVIKDTLSPLHRKTRRYRRISIGNLNRATNSKAEHKEIFQAITEHNAELAQELMAKHIANAKEHMMKGLKKNG